MILVAEIADVPKVFGTPWISLRFHFPPFFSDARAMLECRRLANVAWFPENGPLCFFDDRAA